MKYNDQIVQLENCPPKTFRKSKLRGYRFVFDDDDETVNFIPVAIKDPDRLLDFNEAQKCDSFGLSFFKSLSHAEARFKTLKKRTPQIHKKIGGFLAEVDITPDHGLVSPPDVKSGHFTVHEFSGATWQWNVVKELT